MKLSAFSFILFVFSDPACAFLRKAPPRSLFHMRSSPSVENQTIQNNIKEVDRRIYFASKENDDNGKTVTRRARQTKRKIAQPISGLSDARDEPLCQEQGLENTMSLEYWFDDRIHTLGNIGFTGAIHAALVPLSTKLIDMIAYKGVDIRLRVARELQDVVTAKQNTRVLDMCCGVGISTRALRNAFPKADEIIGLDTSSEMIAMANFLSLHLHFVRPLLLRVAAKLSTSYTVLMERSNKIRQSFRTGMTFAGRGITFTKENAERTMFDRSSFDLVTVMYAFHEAPWEGRQRMLNEARRLLQPSGVLAVVDISTDFKPSMSMLMGEPYVLEYQQNIDEQLERCEGFTDVTYKPLVPGHVGMWLLRRASNTDS